VPGRSRRPVGATPERLKLDVAAGAAQLAGKPECGSPLGVGSRPATLKAGQGRDGVCDAHQLQIIC
jgi:hypothetical protein